jgi:hypothetical protein
MSGRGAHKLCDNIGCGKVAVKHCAGCDQVRWCAAGHVWAPQWRCSRCDCLGSHDVFCLDLTVGLARLSCQTSFAHVRTCLSTSRSLCLTLARAHITPLQPLLRAGGVLCGRVSAGALERRWPQVFLQGVAGRPHFHLCRRARGGSCCRSGWC